MVMLPSAFSLRQTSLNASLFLSVSEMLVAFRLSQSRSYPLSIPIPPFPASFVLLSLHNLSDEMCCAC